MNFKPKHDYLQFLAINQSNQISKVLVQLLLAFILTNGK